MLLIKSTIGASALMPSIPVFANGDKIFALSQNVFQLFRKML